MKVTIDRFEGDYAVCEKSDRSMINIPKANLPKNAKEGDVLNIEGKVIRLDSSETNKRKTQIHDLADELWK
jgi:Protein of unknown function (DUF3006)